MPKKAKKLPKELIVIPNADKEHWREKWTKRRDELNFPASHRIILCGPPGTGKSLTVKNIIARADPTYDEIYLIHCDGNRTREYDDLDVSVLDEIPHPEWWPVEGKKLVILDDIDYKSLGKHQMKNLSRLCGYVSSHYNCSLMICQQDAFEIPALVRRCANVFILWKSHDMTSMAGLASKTGLKAQELCGLFEKFCPGKHDSVWIDMTDGSPMPMRINGYRQVIRGEEKKE